MKKHEKLNCNNKIEGVTKNTRVSIGDNATGVQIQQNTSEYEY